MDLRYRRTWMGAAAIVAAALALAGCGPGAGAGTRNAEVTVSLDFGSQVLGTASQQRVPGSESVMSLLQRHFHVDTRYGGGFVQSIDGHAGGSVKHDWFYYVNGILASKGAAQTDVNQGDHIWWDLHDWRATETVPAVVGEYPEPFANGIGGKLLPTVLDCAPDVQRACDIVAKSLTKAGVKVSFQVIGGGAGSDSLAVVVGTWKDIHGVIAAELVGSGPAHSGVYGQFVGSAGQAIELDDPTGSVVQTLHGSAGMVAATEQASLNQPTWLITGTDVAGVQAAAAALTPAKLQDHFAVAVTGARVIPLPVSPQR